MLVRLPARTPVRLAHTLIRRLFHTLLRRLRPDILLSRVLRGLLRAGLLFRTHFLLPGLNRLLSLLQKLAQQLLYQLFPLLKPAGSLRPFLLFLLSLFRLLRLPPPCFPILALPVPAV